MGLIGSSLVCHMWSICQGGDQM